MSATTRTQPDSTPRVVQHRVGEVVVLRPRGGLDRALAEDLRQLAREANAPVIVHLDDCVLVDPRALQRVAFEWETRRPEMCIVCPRNSARQLLHRARVDRELLIFRDVDLAIEARRLGARWSIAPA